MVSRLSEISVDISVGKIILSCHAMVYGDTFKQCRVRWVAMVIVIYLYVNQISNGERGEDAGDDAGDSTWMIGMWHSP